MPSPRPHDGADKALATTELAGEVRAVLGPTNTGKTHRAIERMLEHATGVIGLPLRLLAREVYDRVTARVGEQAVALVTGEEKRVPARPRYWICTVEAMPAIQDVDFVAVDEVQLAAHRERGHVFTDRLLHWRGRRETWFLGSDTIRPIVERLVPTAVIEGRPRLSTLSDAGALPVGALPPRTAVVAFSATRVYELAERLRARRGGAAVVLGALSPRARNAQVALFQSGEVEYLVATDAIGMGLNMDVDCVVFSETRKFDGRTTRTLEDAELAQIAGRAGRHHKDGRFATLAPLPAFDPRTVRALERHRFDPIARVQWRNHELDFASVDALLASLRRPPFDLAALALTDDAADARALAHLARLPDVAARARGAEAVRLLWDVCQIPDFRQLQLDDHFHLLAAIYLQLAGPTGRLGGEFLAKHVERLDDVRGDLETLLARMATVRTWTYVAHHTRWVEEASRWQARARSIEDRLSDALHDQLVNRFVDRGGRRRGAGPPKKAERNAGVTRGRSLADQLAELQTSAPTDAQTDWLEALIDASSDRFTLDGDGRIRARDPHTPALARLGAGVDLLRPEVTLLLEGLGAGARLQLQRRLVAWTRDLVAELLGPLRATEPGGAAARGLLYQLEQGLGTVRARDARGELKRLSPTERSALAALGIRLGRFVVFAPALLRDEALARRNALVRAALPKGSRLPRLDAATTFARATEEVPHAEALGFPRFGPLLVRADVAEGLGERILRGADARAVAAALGCTPEEGHELRDALLAEAPPHLRSRPPRSRRPRRDGPARARPIAT